MSYRDLFDLQGKVALVHGGGGAIGGEIALGLCDHGATVAVADDDLVAAETCARRLTAAGHKALALQADVTQESDHARVVDAVVAYFGRLDILVNAAGIFQVAEAASLPLATWERTLEVNLTGTFLACQAAAQIMLRQGAGKIINVSSVSGLVGNPRYAAYAASKGGVTLLTRALGNEWCRSGINVNAIAPAFTETGLTRPVLAKDLSLDDVMAKIPMGRLGRVEDLVGAAIFLASRASDFVVGHTLVVDGGRTIG